MLTYSRSIAHLREAKMARSHNTDDEHPAPETPAPTPAASPTGLEERVTKLEEQLAKLMPRIEALTGPLS